MLGVRLSTQLHGHTVVAMSTEPAARVEHPWGRGLLWDVGLGLVLSIMLIVVFSLMFRPHYWVAASITGQ
jgi:hypothetical protein